nr:hypothetical protein HK105_000449 [Polyrhizophydium stewartii]
MFGRFMALGRISAGSPHLHAPVRNGWIDMLKQERPSDLCRLAAETGSLELMQFRFLHFNRDEGCTARAMDLAIGAGHRDVFMFLAEHRNEGCSVLSIEAFIQAQDIRMVRWMHERYPSLFDAALLNLAALSGSLEITRFLHEHCSGTCTTAAMDNAAARGHLDILVFLHEHRTEGCSVEAMNRAATQSAARNALARTNNPKAAVADKEADFEVEQSDIDALYRALDTPIANTSASAGPIARAAAQLSPQRLEALQTALSGIELDRQRDLEHVRARIKGNIADGVHRELLHQLTELIRVNALAQRPKEALEAFTHIGQLGFKPDSVAYNSLIDAYANVSDIDAAVEVFQKMQSAGVTPDMVSFSTLIKACVKTNDFNGAIKLYTRMKQLGLRPNQIVFTTLIKGAIRSRDLERAWMLFDHMRSEIEQPDAVCFNLMIYACKHSQDAERALDLFQEMLDRNLSVSAVTFTSLIQACMTRADYFGEAFLLLERMAAYGVEPTMETYNVLLAGVAQHGDIDRAKLIWNDIVHRASEAAAADGSKPGEVVLGEIKPTQHTYSAMLLAYSRALQLMRDKAREARISADPLAQPAEPAHNREAVLNEARALWSLACDQCKDKDLESQMILHTSYLRLLCEDDSPGGADRALSFWDGFKARFKPSIHAFMPLIRMAMRSPQTYEYGEEVWKELLAWDASCESSITEQSDGHLSEPDKERLRAKQGRSRETMLKAHLMVALGQARADKIDLAIKTLHATTTFRYPFYLPAVHFRDIPAIVDKAQQSADNGDWRLMEELVAICPPETDALSQVQHMLRLRTLPVGSWWGWEILGVDEHQLEVLKRRQRKEHIKLDQRAQAYRDRAANARRASASDMPPKLVRPPRLTAKVPKFVGKKSIKLTGPSASLMGDEHDGR